jgi:hypothetical protein
MFKGKNLTDCDTIKLKKNIYKGCPSREANPGSFDFAYFLFPSLYRCATAASPIIKIF